MYYIFDNLNYMYVTGLLAEIVAVVYFFYSQREKRALALLIGPAIALVAYSLDKAVETDREQIVAVTEKLVDASVTPNTGTMLGTFHDDINASGLNFDQLTSLILKYFAENKPFSSNKVKTIEVLSTNPDRAEAEFTAITVFNPQGNLSGGLVNSRWSFLYKKDSNNRFKISGMTILTLNGSPAPDVFREKF